MIYDNFFFISPNKEYTNFLLENDMYQQQGFTLLELLTSLTIIGILTAIAVPQYSQYRMRAFDARAEGDLRNVALAEEAYFIDAEHYLSCSQYECTNLPGISRLSQGVSLEIVSEDLSFTGIASHPQGSRGEIRWDSELGGLQ